MKIVNSLTLLVLIVTLSISTIIPNMDKAWAQMVVDTVNVGFDIFDLEYNPSNEDIYVANRLSNYVPVIDSATNTVKTKIDTGLYSRALQYNPSNEDMYVAHDGANNARYYVSVIDSSTNTKTATVNIGSGQVDLEYNPSNEDIYVATVGLDSVAVIDSA